MLQGLRPVMKRSRTRVKTRLTAASRVLYYSYIFALPFPVRGRLTPLIGAVADDATPDPE